MATYAKLIYVNGHYYYINSSLKAIRNQTCWISYPNGMMEAGSYTFDAQGRMTNPPEDALTEPVSTFALNGDTMTREYEYIYASGKLLRQNLTVSIDNGVANYTLDFFYDASGIPFALEYNGELFYYITNLQGDVMSIVDAQGAVVASYQYDPYGKVISATGSLAEINPLRYRGYVYDTETTLYYLQSRYYDPEIGRWLTPEPNVFSGAFDEAAGYLKYNTYAYCINNPVKYADYTGEGIILTCVLVFAGLGALFGAAIAAEKSNEQLGYIDGRWVLGGALVGGGAGALVGWGVGILFGPTSQVIGTLTPGLYQTWQQAEQGLRNLYDGVSKAIMTDYGKRVVDCLSNGVAYEAKYGYTRLTKFILRQIEKDIWLLTNGYVDSVEWHFFWSSASNTGGASQQLIDTLLNAGIKVVFH